MEQISIFATGFFVKWGGEPPLFSSQQDFLSQYLKFKKKTEKLRGNLAVLHEGFMGNFFSLGRNAREKRAVIIPAQKVVQNSTRKGRRNTRPHKGSSPVLT